MKITFIIIPIQSNMTSTHLLYFSVFHSILYMRKWCSESSWDLGCSSLLNWSILLFLLAPNYGPRAHVLVVEATKQVGKASFYVTALSGYECAREE